MIIYNSSGIIDEAFIVKAVNKKLEENHRIRRLQNYYEGKHDILNRYYDDDTRPNNKIVVNYMSAISDFLTAYVVGRPVDYENAPQPVLDVLDYNDEAASLQSVALNMNIAGFGCELFYIDEDGFPRYNVIDPKECIFIMDNSLEANLIAFIRCFPKDDEAKGFYVTVYDSTTETEYELTAAVGELKALSPATDHFWQDIPVILYPNNDIMQGSFEQLIPLQDALNKVSSDNVNDFEGFVDSYLVLEGMTATTPEDIADMKRNRVLLTAEDSKAYWLTKSADVARTEQIKRDIVSHIRELGHYPDITDIRGLAISGEAIRMRLITTEIAASKQERILYKGIMRKLELLYNVLRITDPALGTFTDVKPVFSRNFLLDATSDKERVSAISIMLSDEYIDKQKALELNPLIDPDEIDDILMRLGIADYGVADETFPMMGE